MEQGRSHQNTDESIIRINQRVDFFTKFLIIDDQVCIQPQKSKQERKARVGEEWHRNHGRRATQRPARLPLEEHASASAYMSSYATKASPSNPI
jgi:hypothetical protein